MDFGKLAKLVPFPGPFSQDGINAGWSINSENRLPSCNDHSIEITWLNGKQPVFYLIIFPWQPFASQINLKRLPVSTQRPNAMTLPVTAGLEILENFKRLATLVREVFLEPRKSP